MAGGWAGGTFVEAWDIARFSDVSGTKRGLGLSPGGDTSNCAGTGYCLRASWWHGTFRVASPLPARAQDRGDLIDTLSSSGYCPPTAVYNKVTIQGLIHLCYKYHSAVTGWGGSIQSSSLHAKMSLPRPLLAAGRALRRAGVRSRMDAFCRSTFGFRGSRVYLEGQGLSK